MGEGQREGEEPFVAFQVVSHEKPEYTPRLPMASQLLPLSIPELAFSCICTAQACTNTETGTIVNTYFSRRTSVFLGGWGGMVTLCLPSSKDSSCYKEFLNVHVSAFCIPRYTTVSALKLVSGVR